jgi:dolichol-phosphate mannosyltransferase
MSEGPVGADGQEPTVSVVIPMLNEVDGAERCVGSVMEELKRLGPNWSLTIVDDGSRDGTSDVLDRLAAEVVGLNVLHHVHNRGYGAALRTGAQDASRRGAEWVLFMDSDLTNPPGDIPRFAGLMNGSVDYIKASRYASGGAVEGVPFRRRAISRAGNLVSGHMLGLPLSDITNGFRAIRTSPFLTMPLQERGFPLIAEEAYWVARMELRCAEIPTVLTNRDPSLGNSSFRYRPDVVYSYARYPVKALQARLTKGLTSLTRPRKGAR